MKCGISFLALFLIISKVNAIIPKPCADVSHLSSGECCPTPNVPGANVPGANDPGPCGRNLGRGKCETLSEGKFNPFEKDVRKVWPIQYFDKVCNCSERYGGFDCGECSFAYNDGADCSKKTIHKRVPFSKMDEDDWERYRTALQAIKTNPSRYMVAKTDFPVGHGLECKYVKSCTRKDFAGAVNKSLVKPNTYDLFIWIHHFVARQNISPNNIIDYAHEGTGFPTWHRLFLLWLEREIQIQIDDHTFRLPYWEWSDPSQRVTPFQRNRLGANVRRNVNGKLVTVVEGDLFGKNWDTYCWNNPDRGGFTSICDPKTSSNQILRRCPDISLCKEDNPNWPNMSNVDFAVSIKPYDDSPYNRYVGTPEKSFRNYLEGFMLKPEGCQRDTLCTRSVTRKLHNTVHILLGRGDLKQGLNLDFDEQGAMSCVAASPNDPIFINHHANIDCILEKWLQENQDTPYPSSNAIRQGHRGNDYIVPFIPLYTHEDMFKTADNFGYTCSAFLIQSYAALIVAAVAASLADLF